MTRSSNKISVFKELGEGSNFQSKEERISAIC